MTNIKTPRPLISYFGGKQQQAKKLVELIPKHTCYCEPFAGAGSVLFAKPIPDIAKSQYVEVLNDIDENLINMYQVVLQDTDKFVDKLMTIPYSKSVFDNSRDVLKGKIPSDDFERAIAYYINITMAFGNIYLGGWGRTVTKSVAYSWMNRKKDLLTTIERMRNIHFECEDWKVCIDRWDSPHTHFFVDSPYPSACVSAYSRQRDIKTFDNKDYQELINRLDKSPGSFLMCNYPNPDVTIPDDWDCFTYEKTMSATQTGKCMRSAWDKNESAGDFKEINKRTEVVYSRSRKADLSARIWKSWNKPAMDVFKGNDSV